MGGSWNWLRLVSSGGFHVSDDELLGSAIVVLVRLQRGDLYSQNVLY
jgi:hypothetical protein